MKGSNIKLYKVKIQRTLTAIWMHDSMWGIKGTDSPD
jgi:hypothetical protein